MEVEAGGVEGPVVAVAVGGLEVGGGMEDGGVPEAASEVGDKGEVGPELGDLGDEEGVVVDRAECVVEGGVVASFYAAAHLVYVPRSPLHRRLHRHRRRHRRRRRWRWWSDGF